jgi:hypothetical protein
MENSHYQNICSIFLLTIIIRRVLLKLTEPVDVNGGICTEPSILVLSPIIVSFPTYAKCHILMFLPTLAVFETWFITLGGLE